MTDLRPHNPTMINDPGYRAEMITAAGLLIRTPSNRVLVSQRSPKSKTLPGTWQIPGGKVNPSESARDGAIRETKEETGILIDSRSTGRSPIVNTIFENEAGKYRSVVYLVDWPDEKVPADHLEPESMGPWELRHVHDVLADPAGMIPGLKAALEWLKTPPPMPIEPEADEDEEHKEEQPEDLTTTLQKALKRARDNATEMRLFRYVIIFLLTILVVLVAIFVFANVSKKVAGDPHKDVIEITPTGELPTGGK